MMATEVLLRAREMNSHCWALLAIGLAFGCDRPAGSSVDHSARAKSQGIPEAPILSQSKSLDSNGPLRHEQSGPYAELIGRDNPDGFVVVFAPTLYVWLQRAEERKGDLLSETEVLRIRDRAPAIAVTPQQAAKLTGDREYADIDPDDAYASWKRMKEE